MNSKSSGILSIGTCFLIALFVFLQSSVMVAQMPAAIRYELTFQDVDRHAIDVTATFPTEGRRELTLEMPTWTPGSYLIREYARHIEQLTASNAADGSALPIEKQTKNRWTIACDRASAIQVKYRLYAREMGVRTNWVERDYGFLTGAATFLTVPEMASQPHQLRIVPPNTWRDIATAMPHPENDPWTRTARDFDHLVDSPILLGTLDHQTFQAGGKTHHLVTAMGDGHWDHRRAARDVQKIVEVEQAWWGDIPYEEYWFLNIASESGGGLEHDDSCVLMASRWTMKKRASYVDWLSLVAHEFFHTWNVRRLRPQALQQYDYSQEQYIDELWVAEGITSYVDDWFVRKAGLCTEQEYYERLGKSLQGFEQSPGRKVQSLVDSSRDTWIKFYRPDEQAGNARISYYVKGSLVGLLLDHHLRQATQEQKSLRDVMQLLWQRHRQTGYTQKQFESICSELAGEDLTRFFDETIRSTADLNYQPWLERVGLQFAPTEDNATPSPSEDQAKKEENGEKEGGDEKKKEPSSDELPKPTPSWTGLDLASSDGKVVVKKVVRSSPGDIAGINVDDELIALDGYRLSLDSIGDRTQTTTPGQTAQVLIARRGKLLERTMELGVPAPKGYKLKAIAEPTDEQKIQLKSWLDPTP